MLVCGIVFKDNGKIYNFNPNKLEIKVKDYVIVETEKGEQYGKVIYLEEKDVKTTLKDVLRISTDEDYNKYLKNLKDAKDAQNEAKKIVDELKLNMQLIDASYTFDRRQLLFNFISDERIDFRELVKRLAARYKTRIELHQMGVRDKAKETCGLGQCGRQLCCSTFLNHIDAITINMAKNQNIALNPAKINGSCGRLLCCLSYEDDMYTDAKRKVLSNGMKIKNKGREGIIINVDVLNSKYKVDFAGETEEIAFNEIR